MVLSNTAAFRSGLLALGVCASAAAAAIAPAWIPISRCWSDGCIYMWNTSTKQTYRIYQKQAWDGPNPGHCAFSRDGRRLAFIIKGSDDDGVYVVNNDGTNLQRICATKSSSTGQGFCNICWTDRGLFWTENTRQVYWADPDTKTSRALGTIAANTTGNHLRMSRDGSRAYLRTNHDIGDHVGGLLFETNAGLTGIVNERVFGDGEWDHGSVMLNDGSAVIWVVWNCGAFGNPPGCAYHKLFATLNFVDPSQYTIITPNDGHATGWELDGPGWGPYTTPTSDAHILYNRYGTDSNEGHLFFIMDVNTRETVEVTPTQVASGGPISSFNPDFDILGEFWFGDLPNPNPTTPTISLSDNTLLFSDQSVPIAPDTVQVSNTGGGTLTAVSVAESPAASWLTTTLLGSGNDQSIRVAPSANGLASGTYVCTLTVSGGGATNSRTCVVTLSIGAQVLAPSGLSAVHNAGAIDLSWVDNADNETGFEVQRRVSGGAFAALASPAANAVSYRDETAEPGTAYEYRVRATDGTNNSPWSNTATASVPLPPILVTSPSGGETYTVGDQIHIMWQSVSVQTIMIEVTFDGEETWQQITSTGGISQGSADWGDYLWTVPSIPGSSAPGIIRVGEYPTGSTPGFSGTFTVNASSAVTYKAAAAQRWGWTVTQQGNAVRIVGPSGVLPEVRTVRIVDITGRQVALLTLDAGNTCAVWTPRQVSPQPLFATVLQRNDAGESIVLCRDLFQLQ